MTATAFLSGIFGMAGGLILIGVLLALMPLPAAMALHAITQMVVESILSRHLDDLEPRLTRHGYSVRSLADQFSIKPAEIRQFLRGELSGARAQELTQQMQAAGLPL